MNNKILEIAKEILGSEITISTTMSNHPDWSSLKTIQIVMALDDAGIKIPIEKMARINLMNTHGIQNPRELEQAEIVLEIYNELKEYAKVGVSQSYLKLYLKEKKAEKKQLQSIILTEEMVSDLYGLLDVEKRLEMTKQQIRKASSKGELEKATMLDKMMKQMRETQTKLLKGLKKKKELRDMFREGKF